MVTFSENIEVFEKAILKYLITQDDDYVLVDELNVDVDKASIINHIQPSFFSIQAHADLFKCIKDFYKSYNNIPNKDELLKMVELKGITVDHNEFKEMMLISLHKYSPEFLFKYLKSFILVKTLNNQISKVAIKLKSTKINPDNINAIFDYVRTSLGEEIDVDLTNSSDGLDIYDPKSHIQPIKNTKSTGFMYLDTVLGGGWEPKTFVVFAGPPKCGKSLTLSNLAVRAANLGNNVGVFTVELGDRKYTKRLGSNLFSVPYTEYKNYYDDNNLGSLRMAISRYKEENPNAGVIDVKEYPTGSASVIDIENYFLKMQKKKNIKYDLVVVDYVNLLKPEENDEGMYMKIKKICEGLRKIAQRNNWCVVSATQVKQQFFTSSDMTMDAVAESAGLVATVDSLFMISGDELGLKFKNVANRDEGYMNSYANYKKVFDYYRLVEDGDGYSHMELGLSSTIDKYNQTYNIGGNIGNVGNTSLNLNLNSTSTASVNVNGGVSNQLLQHAVQQPVMPQQQPMFNNGGHINVNDVLNNISLSPVK